MNRDKRNTYIRWSIAIIGYYLWFQIFYNVISFHSLFPYANFRDMIIGVSLNFPSILLVFILNIWIVYRQGRHADLKIKICKDIVLSFLVTMGVNWVYLTIIGLFRPARVDWAGTFLNDVIILLGVEMVYYFTRLTTTQKEVEKARLQIIQYQYDVLKSQINPHFLFNSLNLLHSLVSIDTAKSKIFIMELASMYRYIMAKQNCERVTVEEEFEFLKSYVSVLEMRYNNKFAVEIEGTPPDRDIIPFTMQLLIENVTKHNIISSKSPITVRIEITDRCITVSNPVKPKPVESVGRIGLQYLTRLYGANKCDFHVSNTHGVFTAYVPYLP